VRGRQRDSLLGELSEDKPKPLPRQKRVQDDDDVKTPVPTSRTSPNVLDHRTPAARKTPTSDHRITPVGLRNSPADEREQFADRHKTDGDDRGHGYSDSRRSPLDRHDFADRKSPHSDMFRKSPLDRSEFEERKESFERYGASRKSPSEKLSSMDRKSPHSDMFQKSPLERSEFEERKESFERYGASRKSPSEKLSTMDRKSPHSDMFRRSPLDRSEFEEGKESFERYGTSRKLPAEKPIPTDRKSSVTDHRPSNASSRKSPYEGDTFTSYNREKSPADDRKSPGRDLRKTPVDFQRKKEGTPSAHKRGSVVDFLTDSTGVKETESSDDENKHRVQRKSSSPQSRGQNSSSPAFKRSGSTDKNPFDEIGKSPGATSKASKRNRTPESWDAKPGRQHSQVIFCCDCVLLY